MWVLWSVGLASGLWGDSGCPHHGLPQPFWACLQLGLQVLETLQHVPAYVSMDILPSWSAVEL